jgi:general secretion pathway protein M
MKDWFESLESRERLFVSAGTIVIVITLFWVLIWQPLEKGHDTLVRSVDNWGRSLDELRPLKGLTASSENVPSGSPTGAQQTPVVIVDQTLRARGLDRSLKRSQPTTSTGIRVEFENVAFDDLVLWLGDLSGQYSMHVQSGSLSTSSQAGPGRINATLTIERSP